MFYNIFLLILLRVCLNLSTSRSQAIGEDCGLKVNVITSEDPGIEPVVVCSSDCATPGKTFYYYDENLEKKKLGPYVEVKYDDEGNVTCHIKGIPQEDDSDSDSSISDESEESQEILYQSTESEESEEWLDSPKNSVVTDESGRIHQSLESEESEGELTNSMRTAVTTVSTQLKENPKNDLFSDESEGILSSLQLQNPEDISETDDIEPHPSTSYNDYEPSEVAKETPDLSEGETTVKSNKPETESEITENLPKNYESSDKINETFDLPEDETRTETNKPEEQTLINDDVSKKYEENYEENELGEDYIILTPESIQIAYPRCPKGWALNTDSNTCYFITANDMSWYDAEKVCVDLGGRLSIFHTETEVNFVKENVGLNDSVWIGLEYTFSEDEAIKTWSWIDKSEADFTDWAAGEPSSGTTFWGNFWSYETCVQMKKSQNLAWSDEPCTNFRRALCSKDAVMIPVGSCPNGWVLHGNKCYHLCTQELTEELAVLMCSSHIPDGKLFVPQNLSEIEFVASQLKEKEIPSVWIGVKDSEDDRDFHRTPEEEGEEEEEEDPIFFTWDENEPSKSFWWFTNKECVQMSCEGKMKRAECGEKLLSVCSFEI